MVSNDSVTPESILELVGRGVENQCPIPVLAQHSISGRPLDVITLDASASRDPDGPDGKPIEYTWVVVERPDGSTAQPVDLS